MVRSVLVLRVTASIVHLNLKAPTHGLRPFTTFFNPLHKKGQLGSPFFLNKMSTSNFVNNEKQMERLASNAQLAENIIADIYAKLGELEKGNVVLVGSSVTTPELVHLRQENESLRLEVAKWKELLVLREIRNGAPSIVSTPSEVGKHVGGGGSGKSKSKTAVKSSASSSGGKPSSTAKSPGPSKSSVSVKKSSTSAAGPSKSNVNHAVTAPSKSTTSVKEKKPTTAPAPVTSGGGSGAGSGGTAAAEGDDVDVSKLDFRVGLITQCERHPDADALYVEKIELGEDKPRTIISGLVKHVPIEEMQNRLVIVLTNLKPAKMRGIMSEGMVMCASSPEKVEILIPPSGSVPGDLVEVEGYPRAPEAVLNPKKKIFETVQPDLKTNEKLEATYKGKLWTVPGKGVILTSSLTNTMIK